MPSHTSTSAVYLRLPFGFAHVLEGAPPAGGKDVNLELEGLGPGEVDEGGVSFVAVRTCALRDDHLLAHGVDGCTDPIICGDLASHAITTIIMVTTTRDTALASIIPCNNNNSHIKEASSP